LTPAVDRENVPLMRLGRILAVLFVLGILGLGGAYAYYDKAVTTPVDASAKKVEFEVKKGATLNSVGKQLEAEGLIASATLWRVYLKLHATAPSPKAGRHEVSASMNVPELIETLAGAPIPDDVPLTMVEGWRLVDADAALAEKGLIEAGAYIEAASDPSRFTIPFPAPPGTLEGYLLPETYAVPPGKLDVDKLIQRQIGAFHRRFVKPHAAEIEKSGRTLDDIVKVASLLEREEPNPETRPKVAGVMYNRLDSNTPLGIDATSRYTLENWNERKPFLAKLRDPNDPYNTRLKSGLPPTAIGAASLPSLLAALRPEPSKYWYYLHDSKRRIHFARTAEEHEANRKKYNVW
jgi:UPF0755 protein